MINNHQNINKTVVSLFESEPQIYFLFQIETVQKHRLLAIARNIQRRANWQGLFKTTINFIFDYEKLGFHSIFVEACFSRLF